MDHSSDAEEDVGRKESEERLLASSSPRSTYLTDVRSIAETDLKDTLDFISAQQASREAQTKDFLTAIDMMFSKDQHTETISAFKQPQAERDNKTEQTLKFADDLLGIFRDAGAVVAGQGASQMLQVSSSSSGRQSNGNRDDQVESGLDRFRATRDADRKLLKLVFEAGKGVVAGETSANQTQGGRTDHREDADADALAQAVFGRDLGQGEDKMEQRLAAMLKGVRKMLNGLGENA